MKRISTINYYGQVCFLLLLLAFCNMLHAQTPYYKIGDHYTDELGQQGIIASISNDNRTGWMVALQDVPSSRNWSRITNIPVPNMNVIPTPASNVYEWGIYIPVTADRDGYDNTAKMRAAGSSEEFAAAYYVDYENGWYIPSVGQMRVVAFSQPLLGISLYEDTYWTSTQNSAANAWAINIEDYSYEVIEKIYAHRIRPVKNINFERQIILEVNDPIMGSATSDCDVCVNDTCSCLYGATVVLTATANEGYHFTQWQDGNTQNLRTLTFTNDATYTAFFAINNYILTVNSDNAAMGTAAGGGTFDFGTTATLTATPAVGYHFTQWQDGNTQNPHTVIVTEAALYTASFDINSYTISAYSNDVTMGSVTGGGTYDYGTTATLTATSAVGHHFTQWQDGNTQNPHTVTVAGTATYTATFEINTYIVSVNSDNVAMGTAAGGGIFTHGAITTLTATPAVGHHFTQWQDGSTLNPHTVTVTATATYTANFEVNNYTLTVNSDDDNMGTATGGGTYNYGATAILTATPATEHHFVSWQDGNTHNPRTLIVTQTATYTASFEINSYTITVNSNDDDMGTVTGGGTYNYGATVTLTATAAAGHRFVQWQDGNSQSPRTITVAEAAVYTATFEMETATIEIETSVNGTVEGGGTYSVGEEITLTATPDDCYEFISWSDGNTENPRTIVVAENMTLTATFSMISYNVALTANVDTMGTVVGAGNYNCGSEATLVALPNTGFHFVKWSDENTENPRIFTVSEDYTLIAEFAPNVGISDNEFGNETMVVYPNPTTGLVACGRQDVRQIEVFDCTGKQVLSTQNQSTINLSTLAPGLYTLRIMLPDGIVMKKVMKK